MRIALIVFVSIVAVEAAILLPSLRNYERDLLRRIEDATIATLTAGIATGTIRPGLDLSMLAATFTEHTPLRGAALYGPSGDIVGTLGEVPVFGLSAIDGLGRFERRVDDGARYEMVFPAAESGLPYTVVARADSSWLRDELWAFVMRIGGLVLLISCFVTGTTVVILGQTVLDPLLRLREKLNAAAEDPEHPERYAVATPRADEFGDVVERFNGLLQLISKTHRTAMARAVAMTDNSIDGIVAYDTEGQLVYANRAALSFFAVPDMAALARLHWYLQRAGSADQMSLAESLLEGPYSRELKLIMPGGEHRPVLLGASALTDEAGRTTLVYASIRDITKLKKAEQAARSSEIQIRLIADGLPAFIAAVDRDLRYQFVNRAYEQLLGRSRDQIIGQSMPDLLREEGFAGIRQPSERVLNGETVTFERIQDSATLGIRHLRGTLVPNQADDGTVNGFYALAEDVTEAKRAEEALHAAKSEAEQANRAKTEFLANMSHELRTPLNAILGFSEMIAKQTFGPVGSERYSEYASDIHDSGAHLLGIINSILDLSKIEAGRYELHEQPVSLDELAESCVRMMADQAISSGVRMERRVDRHLPRLHADKRACKQVLLNLLSNSLKFTPAGGHIWLNAELDQRGGLCLAVHDTGIGIPAEQLDRVVRPFTQVDSSLARKHEGTGLGLSLVRSLVELHGGEISIQSALGAGTTITIRFPAARTLRHSPHHERMRAG